MPPAITEVAAKAMRKEIRQILIDVESSTTQKAIFDAEMQNFFSLFTRYLSERLKNQDTPDCHPNSLVFRASSGEESSEKITNRADAEPLPGRQPNSAGEDHCQGSSANPEFRGQTANLFSQSREFGINGGEFNAVGRDMHSSTIATHNDNSTTIFMFADNGSNSCPTIDTPSPTPPSANANLHRDPKRRSRWSTNTFIHVYHHYIQPVVMDPVWWMASYFVPGAPYSSLPCWWWCPNYFGLSR
ncbi:hypothetical protein GYMLUDRAFT_84509 [Collybiopsis luxurians FD-317 M1]|uniref:Uncharacterized protein n=1 Tax=Collybiopsis luxurians FD-317 M1 TaxID=944289 RepID=A0A0D0BFJ6_9AGAR|nr:hypothetical protein GYMLUDRAFT_84509 [Collybiopsis luxurians FD-317 M1]